MYRPVELPPLGDVDVKIAATGAVEVSGLSSIVLP
jgi:hypothetical protein